MRRLYPIADKPMVSPVVERYGQRSAQGIQVQQQLAGLYTKDASGQHQLDLIKVKEQLLQLREELRSAHGRVAAASDQVLAIAHALLLTCEQMRDANARDLTISRDCCEMPRNVSGATRRCFSGREKRGVLVSRGTDAPS